jgi:hypothetical protein
VRYGSSLLAANSDEPSFKCARCRALLAAEDVAVGRVVHQDGVALAERAGEQAAGDGVLHLPLHHPPQRPGAGSKSGRC